VGGGESDYSFYSTNDKGETWARYDIKANLFNTYPNKIYCRKMIFIDEKVGWIAGAMQDTYNHPIYGNVEIERDYILKTTNGGKTWGIKFVSDDDTVNAFGLSDIAFSKDGKNGIVVGNGGKIRRTYDGGNTWIREYGKNHVSTLGKTIGLHAFFLGSKPFITIGGGDGVIWYDGTVGIEEIFLRTDFNSKLYPNPATDNTTLTLELQQPSQVHITLNDMLGREIKQIYNAFTDAGTFTYSFATQDLPKGIYYLKIFIGGEVKVEKVVVN
jgi:hypothetical protein